MTPTRNEKSPAKKPAKGQLNGSVDGAKRAKKGAEDSTKAAPARVNSTAEPGSGRRIQVRRSSVHGKGVFALQPIAKKETVIEYVGRIVTWKEAQRQPPHDPSDPNHTFFFHIDEK